MSCSLFRQSIIRSVPDPAYNLHAAFSVSFESSLMQITLFELSCSQKTLARSVQFIFIGGLKF
jgi:hypothetical protein